MEKVYKEFSKQLRNKASLNYLKTLMDTPGFDVDYYDPFIHFGNTFVMQALLLDRAAVVGELLDRGASLYNPNPFVQGYPFVAADRGNMKVLRLLIAHSDDINVYVNQRNRSDKSLVYVAANSGQKEIVELLLSRGADVDIDAINIARARGYEDIAHILETWETARIIPVFNDVGPAMGFGSMHNEDLINLYEYMGKKGRDYDGGVDDGDVLYYGGRKKTIKKRRNKRMRKSNKKRR
jgi:ankyrin repeat protein